tara:strand:+ start:752 stop:1063 length:312 start_codon:yes stop_codon:yes gene_type:complete
MSKFNAEISPSSQSFRIRSFIFLRISLRLSSLRSVKALHFSLIALIRQNLYASSLARIQSLSLSFLAVFGFISLGCLDLLKRKLAAVCVAPLTCRILKLKSLI